MAPCRRRATAAFGAARLAGASRHGEPNGGYQREEERAVNTVLTIRGTRWHGKAGGEEEERRQAAVESGGGAPVGFWRSGCEHEVHRDEAMPTVEAAKAEELPRRR